MKVMRRVPPRVERVFECNTEVGESPLWDATTGLLYWVDITEGQVFCGDPVTGKYTRRSANGPAGSLALCRSGGLLVAAGQRLVQWSRDLAASEPACVATMPIRPVPSRFNDGKAGPDGKLWVGSMDPQPARGASGAIHGMAPGQQPVLLAQHLLVPNGIAWSPAGDRMVFSDSGRGAVWSVPFDPVHGPLGCRPHGWTGAWILWACPMVQPWTRRAVIGVVASSPAQSIASISLAPTWRATACPSVSPRCAASAGTTSGHCLSPP